MPENFIVTSLPDYVQENRDLLIREVVLGARTISRMRKQTGIKGSAALNYLEVKPTIQAGSGCAYNAAGTAELTQRQIVTAVFKVNMDICPETIRGKWAEHLLNTNANEGGLPFEAEVIREIRESIDEQLEVIVWQSDTSNGGLIDGLLVIAEDESDVIDVAISAGSSAYQGLLAVYNAIPEKTLKKRPAINVAPAIFRAFTQELVALNLFHVTVPDEELDEIFLPGTGCRVVKTEGLTGSLKVLATYDNNMYYGCDLENDREVIKVVYDEKTEGYAIIVKWNSGVQFAFPDEVVLGTFAEAPVSPDSPASLAAIAQNTGAIATQTQAIAAAVTPEQGHDALPAAVENLGTIMQGVATDVSAMGTDLSGIKADQDALAGTVDDTNDAIKTLAVTPEP